MATKADRVKAMFKANPSINILCVTADGFGFTEANKANAEAHQATLEKGSLEMVKRTDVFPVEAKTDEDPRFLDGNLKSIKAGVKEIDNIEELKAYLEEEESKGEEARKGAVEAIEGRIAELIKNIDVDVDNENTSGNSPEATSEKTE